MNSVRTVWLALGLLGASLFAGVGLPFLAGAADAKPATVTVMGNGTATTVPDTASMSFGVTTQAPTAAAALAANSGDMAKVIAALKGAGVAAKDIQTQAVSLQPRTSENGDAIVGYTATNEVSAVVRDLGRLGAVIDAAVGAGANTVSGPSLTREDTAALHRDALQAAFAEAKERATALAQAAKATLGAVQSISEASVPGPLPADRLQAVSATPIEPGTQQIQATVTVEFGIA
jgi:uncharacterized protein YggE